MAAEEPKPTSKFAEPILALKMRLASVKVVLGNAVWTGTIVGQKSGKTLVLTVAHGTFGIEMSTEDLEKIMRVEFWNELRLRPCRIAKIVRNADIMLLLVDRETSYVYVMKLAPKEECNLSESQLIGGRGHPVGHDWLLAYGPVVTPLLCNKYTGAFPLDFYSKEIVYFKHRLDLPKGTSGTALVNLNGNIVGMEAGAPTNSYKVLGATKILNTTTDFSSLRCGRSDVVDIEVQQSRTELALHVKFIKQILQGDSNQSLEDLYITDPSAGVGSSSSR